MIATQLSQLRNRREVGGLKMFSLIIFNRTGNRTPSFDEDRINRKKPNCVNAVFVYSIRSFFLSSNRAVAQKFEKWGEGAF